MHDIRRAIRRTLWKRNERRKKNLTFLIQLQSSITHVADLKGQTSCVRIWTKYASSYSAYALRVSNRRMRQSKWNPTHTATRDADLDRRHFDSERVSTVEKRGNGYLMRSNQFLLSIVFSDDTDSNEWESWVGRYNQASLAITDAGHICSDRKRSDTVRGRRKYVYVRWSRLSSTLARMEEHDSGNYDCNSDEASHQSFDK